MEIPFAHARDYTREDSGSCPATRNRLLQNNFSNPGKRRAALLLSTVVSVVAASAITHLLISIIGREKITLPIAAVTSAGLVVLALVICWACSWSTLQHVATLPAGKKLLERVAFPRLSVALTTAAVSAAMFVIALLDQPTRPILPAATTTPVDYSVESAKLDDAIAELKRSGSPLKAQAAEKTP